MYDYILKRKLKKYYKSHSREKCFRNWKDMHTVLVLFDTAGFEAADLFIHQLAGSGKKVMAYAYQRKQDKQDYSTTGYHILSEKDAGKWFDNPVDTIAREIEKEAFDVVIDLTVRRNIPLEYLLAHADAFVKTGFKKSNYPSYDLSITALPYADTDNIQVEELGKQIVYYLEMIQAG